MKILFVSIPNHHFFQWANQLREGGYEVFWFDITDGAGFVNKIQWITQFNGWKLKWNYPFRYRIKNHFPKFYTILQSITTNRTEIVFEKIIKTIQPDVVHCFEMQLAGLPILSVMQKNQIPFIYSSWGSDMYDYRNLDVIDRQATEFLNRVDYLMTDCNRDYLIAQRLGFKNKFLGVYPGNGGITIENEYIKTVEDRKTICIKGYEDGVGRALTVLKAIESVKFDTSINFLVFSADEIVIKYINKSVYFKEKKIKIIARNSFLDNKILLQKLGSCLLYIGNSSSDGMPNSLLEAMGMGAFPINSNPGKATEEIITNGKNGFLIQNPNDNSEIAKHIKNAMQSETLLQNSQKYNVAFIADNYNRNSLKDKIIPLYQQLI